MASGPITAWQIEGGKVEVVADFLFLGSKITGRWLQPWNQKSMASSQKSNDKPRQCLEKQRHYSAYKGPYSQGYGLPGGYVWLWELDHKEGRKPKNWCLELWCWRRLLKAPWTSRRSNQSVLKEFNLEYSLEGLMLKLKLQYFGQLMWKDQPLEKSLTLGKIEGRMRRGHQRWLDGITDVMNMNLSKSWKIVRKRETWHAAVHGVAKSQTWLGDWTITIHLQRERQCWLFFCFKACFKLSFWNAVIIQNLLNF